MTSPASLLRVGVVPYLNMLPLTHGLDSLRLESDPAARLQIIAVPPSEMSRMMDEGTLDVGMVPVGAFVNRPNWKQVGRSMIGSRGAVASVLVKSISPVHKWKILHPDSHSRTSNLLARVILNGRYGIDPALGQPIPLTDWELPARPQTGEAFILIGTRALHWREAWPDGTTLDLGKVWSEWTGLPFVYALWATREGLDLETHRVAEWMEEFERLKERNLQNLDAVISAGASLADERITSAEARRYLTENITFDFGDDERLALVRFRLELSRLNLLDHRD